MFHFSFTVITCFFHIFFFSLSSFFFLPIFPFFLFPFFFFCRPSQSSARGESPPLPPRYATAWTPPYAPLMLATPSYSCPRIFRISVTFSISVAMTAVGSYPFWLSTSMKPKKVSLIFRCERLHYWKSTFSQYFQINSKLYIYIYIFFLNTGRKAPPPGWRPEAAASTASRSYATVYSYIL